MNEIAIVSAVGATPELDDAQTSPPSQSGVVSLEAPSPLKHSATTASDLSRRFSRKPSMVGMVRNMMVPQMRPWYIIDPREARFVPYWDATTTLALIFTALCTPYEVAFLPPSRQPTDTWFILNRLIDFVFFSDFILQWFLAYMEPASRDQAAQWVFSPRKIAWRYTTSFWFPLDVCSILVAALDYLELQVVQDALRADGESSGADGLSDLKALRVLRALRLIKLVRLIRASKILKRWEVRYAINYGYLEMSKTIFKVVFLCHIFACLWALQAGFQDTKVDSWMGS